MELSIRFKLLKNIEFYQEYIFQEQRTSESRLITWKIEKELLKWTTYNHYHLGSELNKETITRRILVDKEKKGLDQAIENLVEREFAKWKNESNHEDGIIISKDGFLMGEVINDLEEGFWSNLKYWFLYKLGWATVLSGAFLIIINLI